MIGGGGVVLKRSRYLFLSALTTACPDGFLVVLQVQIAGNDWAGFGRDIRKCWVLDTRSLF